MANDETNVGEPLLYDPLFETPPDTVIRDTPGRGFFGKAVVKKAIFVLVLMLFVGVSIFLSFNSLAKARFHYEETDGGMMLSEFNANKVDPVLEVGPVFTADGTAKTDGKVVAVRSFAVCCNENTSFILIGKDVVDIPETAFYSCTALQAILVDPENPNYRSDNGVLYKLTDGQPTELMLYPARHDLYGTMLALGEQPPANAEEAAAFAARSEALAKKTEDWLEALKKDDAPETPTDPEQAAWLNALQYDVLPGVTEIGAMAFAECEALTHVTIPEGVSNFKSMAFFKCVSLRSLRLPDSTLEIGSDAFSYCEKIPELYIPASVKSIGHHAFFGCKGVTEMHMACAENELPQVGEDWLPQQKRGLFSHDVPVVYNAERGAEA
ncbi:MAG: leucine-rich repeat domain-containing protein [Clostridia bacterium]|nr:leucine-rich repeat domain-containing protein [Clostridia bacterium]